MKTISFIGSGKVATHLARQYKGKGYSILSVYSRKFDNAHRMALKVGAKPVKSINDLIESDILIIAVTDDTIKNVAKDIPFNCAKIIVHTSGTVEADVLSNCGDNTGIFYPLQTFTLNRDVNLSNVPFCIEASNEDTFTKLRSFALDLTNQVYNLNSEQRKHLHLAAVMACNFSNHFYSLAESYMTRHKLSFEMLHPLIIETASKIEIASPALNQTGPAIRKDKKVIETHLELLENHPELKKMYNLITDNILSFHGKGKL